MESKYSHNHYSKLFNLNLALSEKVEDSDFVFFEGWTEGKIGSEIKLYLCHTL